MQRVHVTVNMDSGGNWKRYGRFIRREKMKNDPVIDGSRRNNTRGKTRNEDTSPAIFSSDRPKDRKNNDAKNERSTGPVSGHLGLRNGDLRMWMTGR